MPQIRIINARGEVLQLYPSEDYIVEVQGVTPVAADVSYSDVAGGDGGLFNAARVGVRSIELLIAPRGPDIERKRLRLYQFFRAKTLPLRTFPRKSVIPENGIMTAKILLQILPLTLSIKKKHMK